MPVSTWRDSKAVMQRIANPSSPVRLRVAPPKNISKIKNLQGPASPGLSSFSTAETHSNRLKTDRQRPYIPFTRDSQPLEIVCVILPPKNVSFS